MNYEVSKIFDSNSTAIKGLLELVDALINIDEDSTANSENEWTITDENGEKIILNYSQNNRELTLTKKGLKLTLGIEKTPVKVTRFIIKD